MSTTSRTLQLTKKAVAATVVCGALALGSAGVASAATTTTTGSGTKAPAAKHIPCTRAPRALARINRVEAAIAKRLPRFQAAEKKVSAAGHTKVAARIEKRIHRAQKVQGRIGALATKIHTKCPSATAATHTPGAAPA